MKASTAYFSISVISAGCGFYTYPRVFHIGFTVAALLCAVAAFCAAIAYLERGQ